ncbi:hypothetical protein Bbelb_332940 [Branchiostoma belcheri]|nr:hypothetical protein Bbelb_332940 [Branchiostoma belcheri]
MWPWSRGSALCRPSKQSGVAETIAETGDHLCDNWLLLVPYFVGLEPLQAADIERQTFGQTRRAGLLIDEMPAERDGDVRSSVTMCSFWPAGVEPAEPRDSYPSCAEAGPSLMFLVDSLRHQNVLPVTVRRAALCDAGRWSVR